MPNNPPPVAAARATDAERRRIALRRLLDHHHMTPTGLARVIGTKTPNAIFNFLNGYSGSLSQRTLEKILAAFPDGSADDFIGRPTRNVSVVPEGRGELPGYRVVHVAAVAKAGAWRLTFDLPAAEQSTFLVPVTFGIDGPGIFAVRVEAPGAEQIYPPGAVLICGPAPADIATLTPGARVVVQTIRDGLTEVTIREAVLHDGKTWLWPWSTHPDHQAPVLAPWHRSALERARTGEVVKIAAFVYASWQPEWPTTPD
jgi:hypothetical protein